MKKGFTLIELLVVSGIIAILAVVAVMTLNPAELLKQSRDARRVADLSTINKAVSVYYSDALNNPSTLFMGSSSVIYISVPDSSSSCNNLGLPTPPSGYAYHCAPSSTYRRTDGTGWIPVNLSAASVGAAISAWPVDPQNQTSTGLYYVYATDGGANYEITSLMESAKQRAAFEAKPSIDQYPGVVAQGTPAATSPLYNPTGLIGYWKLDEGSGSIAADSSGNNYSGTLINGPSWTAGNVNKALAFSGASQDPSGTYVSIGNVSALVPSSSITVSAWIQTVSTAENSVVDKSDCLGGHGDGSWELLYGGTDTGPGYPQFVTYYPQIGNTYASAFNTSGPKVNDGKWHLLTGTGDGAAMHLYVDGVLDADSSYNGIYSGSQSMTIGGYCDGQFHTVNGTIDDVRVYNRLYSAAEVMALYNAGR